MNEHLSSWHENIMPHILKELSDCGHLEWSPYTYWRRKPYKGRLINIDSEGHRVTFSFNKPDKTIWMFGSSTLWGSYVADLDTIPSLLAQELYHQGIKTKIINFAESSYVSTQELIELILQLRKGKPDIVVFYNGINDILSLIKNGVPGLPRQERYRRQEFNLTHPKHFSRLTKTWVHKLLRLKNCYLEINPSSETIQEALNIYKKNMDIAYALSCSYGFKLLVYWEPCIFDSSETADEIPPFYKSVFKQAKPKSRIYLQDLSLLFNREQEPLYYDWLHYTKKGNRIVAKRIAQDI